MKKIVYTSLAVIVSLILLTGEAWAPPPGGQPPGNLAQEVADLQAAVAALQAENAAQQAEIANLQLELNQEIEARNAGDVALETDITDFGNNTVLDLNGILTLDTSGEYPTALFSGVNVQVINGLDATDTVNGLGNLIVGYNEPRGENDDRSGSHFLVIGTENNYSSYGGLIAGLHNNILGEYGTVGGGSNNTASGKFSSVSGGVRNSAGGNSSTVSGGAGNNAEAYFSSVSGGSNNTAEEYYSSVSGGNANHAIGYLSSVSGGAANTASGDYSSVSGGRANHADGAWSSVSGGELHTVDTDGETVNNEIVALQSSINYEVSRRQSADVDLQSQIDSTQSGLAAEINTRQSNDGNLQGRIDSTQSDLAAEISTRQSNDDYHTNEITIVHLGLITETATRQSNDGNLQSQITSVQSGLATDLAAEVSTRQGEVADLQSQIEQMVQVPQNLLDLAEFVSVDRNDLNGLSGPHVIFEGANVHVINGSGLTDLDNGLGNLIVGYNENDGDAIRTGSHNLVVGSEHTYTSYGGLVVGYNNAITGEYSSVSGGRSNTASGPYASVSGGDTNEASGDYSSISGGYWNKANSDWSSVSGGNQNSTSLPYETETTPDYDSGWVGLDWGETIRLHHGLGGNKDNYVVNMQIKNRWADELMLTGYGCDSFGTYGDDYSLGACWYGLTNQELLVYRGQDESNISAVRIKIYNNH